jgi:beta-glucosidase
MNDSGMRVPAALTAYLALMACGAAARGVAKLPYQHLKFPPVEGAPLLALRGFQRIHLNPGASQKVHFELKNRDLGMVTEDGHPIVAEGDYTISVGGGQPETGAPGVTGHFRVQGQIGLPE